MSKSNQHQQQLDTLAKRLELDAAGSALLVQALTHPAFFEGSRTHRGGDNQRLEFLGDAVLDLIAGEYLYHAYPDAQEGQLSKMRAFLVCEASLAEAARELGLGQCLRLGRGSELSGDRERPSVLADAYEAMLGAVFVSRGVEAARQVILGQFAGRMDKLTADDYEDKKSLLQEVVQAVNPHGVNYRLLGSSGPDHNPSFESAAYCGQQLLGSGTGRSKKESEVAAAAAALAHRDSWLSKIQ